MLSREVLLTSPEGAWVDGGNRPAVRKKKGSENYNLIKAIWNHNLGIFITKNTTKPIAPLILAGDTSVRGLKMMNSWRYMSSSSSKSMAGQVNSVKDYDFDGILRNLDLNFQSYRKSLIALSQGCSFLCVAVLDGVRLSTCLQPWMSFIYLSTSKQVLHFSSCQHPVGPYICKPNYLSTPHPRVPFTCLP